jgi:hypothetical protein
MSNHWYSITGAPRHTRENGKPVTLREARKENLFPSVTTILKILAKPSLDKWKVEQAVKAGLMAPDHLNHEALEDRVRVVTESLHSELAKAREFGDAVHNGIEHVNIHGTPPPPMSQIAQRAPRLSEWLELYHTWQQENLAEVISSEAVVVNCALGYAGRCDLVARHKVHGVVVVDFKTQRVRNGRPAFYDEWIYQLAPYKEAQPKVEIQGCLSLVIDSNAPSAPVEKLWSGEETAHGWEVFRRVLEAWQTINNYKPKPI